jgi:hypothetical protein
MQPGRYLQSIFVLCTGLPLAAACCRHTVNDAGDRFDAQIVIVVGDVAGQGRGRASTSMPSSPLPMARLRTTRVPVAPLSTRIPLARLLLSKLPEMTVSRERPPPPALVTKTAGPRPPMKLLRDDTYLVPVDVRAEVNTAVAVFETQGPVVTEALRQLDRANTVAWKAVNLVEVTDEEWQLVKRTIGIERGWNTAYRLVSTLDLPGQDHPAT